MNPSSRAVASNPEPASLNFAGVEYFHRWSKDNQHEYTPKDQEDLAIWSELITVNRYTTVKTGEDLAGVANNLLENYKTHGAMVVKTDSVPRTVDKPAEYLICVLFPRPDLIEAVFCRLVISNDTGASYVYSHREYGKKIGNEMSAWLQKNGKAVEMSLMSWPGPALPAARK